MLRDYQVRTVGACLPLLRAGRHTCLVLPTGGGKTVTSRAIIEAFGEPSAFLTHRVELAEQAGAAGIPGALSWQALALNPKPRPEVKLLVVDECHFSASGGPWEQALQAFPNAVRLGLTATPSRGDGQPLGRVFDEIVVGASYSELIAAGHLVQARVFRPSEELDGLAKTPLAEYQARTPGKKAVVFAGGTAEGREVADSFVAAGYRAAFVGQGTGDEERARHVRALEAGELDVLVNVFVLSAGWDSPSCEVAILARGFESASTYLQACGRVLRPAPGKTEAFVLDLRGVSHRHGLPTQDRVYSLTGKAIQTVAPLRLCPACGFCFEPGPAVCPSCKYRPTAQERRAQILNETTEEATEKLPADLEELERLTTLANSKGWSADWAVRAYRKTHIRPVEWPSQTYSAIYNSLRKQGVPRVQAHARTKKTLT